MARPPVVGVKVVRRAAPKAVPRAAPRAGPAVMARVQRGAWMCVHTQAAAAKAVPSLVLRADLGVSRAVRETVLALGAQRRTTTLNPGSNWFELIILRCIIVGRLSSLAD